MSSEVPEGRWGFTLEPEDVDEVDADLSETDGEWYRYSEGCSCWRPT